MRLFLTMCVVLASLGAGRPVAAQATNTPTPVGPTNTAIPQYMNGCQVNDPRLPLVSPRVWAFAGRYPLTFPETTNSAGFVTTAASFTIQAGVTRIGFIPLGTVSPSGGDLASVFRRASDNALPWFGGAGLISGWNEPGIPTDPGWPGASVTLQYRRWVPSASPIYSGDACFYNTVDLPPTVTPTVTTTPSLIPTVTATRTATAVVTAAPPLSLCPSGYLGSRLNVTTSSKVYVPATALITRLGLLPDRMRYFSSDGVTTLGSVVIFLLPDFTNPNVVVAPLTGGAYYRFNGDGAVYLCYVSTRATPTPGSATVTRTAVATRTRTPTRTLLPGQSPVVPTVTRTIAPTQTMIPSPTTPPSCAPPVTRSIECEIWSVNLTQVALLNTMVAVDRGTPFAYTRPTTNAAGVPLPELAEIACTYDPCASTRDAIDAVTDVAGNLAAQPNAESCAGLSFPDLSGGGQWSITGVGPILCQIVEFLTPVRYVTQLASTALFILGIIGFYMRNLRRMGDV